jgi:phage-related protein
MEIICYRMKTGRSPAKEYISSRYGINESKDNKRMQANKVKRLTKIDNVITMAAEKRGRPGGDFSSSLIGYDFHELRISEGDELVRILYFAFQGDRLVLLNAYDKPNLYEKAGKKEINKKIQRIHEQTKLYYEDFLKHPDQYEKYDE